LLLKTCARHGGRGSSFFFSSRRRHTRSVSAFLLNRSSDLYAVLSRISLRGRSAASLRQNCVTVFSFSKNHFSSPSGRWSIVLLRSEERRVGKECRSWWWS